METEVKSKPQPHMTTYFPGLVQCFPS